MFKLLIKEDNYQFRNINYQLTIIRLSIKNNEIINENTIKIINFKNMICNCNLSKRGTTLLNRDQQSVYKDQSQMIKVNYKF